MLKFDWDKRKNKINIAKHGISFKEAISVFRDEEGILIFDSKHSIVEERWVLIGLSDELNLLVVVHVYKNDDTIRLISARYATKKEMVDYERRKK